MKKLMIFGLVLCLMLGAFSTVVSAADDDTVSVYVTVVTFDGASQTIALAHQRVVVIDADHDGALTMNDALYHEYSILITKGILDCIIVMALTSSIGKGAVFSVIPLAIWQGLMTLLAQLIAPMMTESALANLSMVGNVLICCVGLNLAFPVKIKVANYLPALLIAVGWAVFG